MSTPAPTERLDTGQIAEFLRVTRKHVTNRLTKSPDFPRAGILRDLSEAAGLFRCENFTRLALLPAPLLTRPKDSRNE